MWLELTHLGDGETVERGTIFTQNMDKVSRLYFEPRPYVPQVDIRYVDRFRTATREYERPTDIGRHGDEWFVYTVLEDGRLEMEGPGRMKYTRCPFSVAALQYNAPENQEAITAYQKKLWERDDDGFTLLVMEDGSSVIVLQSKKVITKALKSGREYANLTGYASGR